MKQNGDYSRKACSVCGCVDTVLRRNIARNNVNQFFWWCENCHYFAAGANFIPHETIKEWQQTKRLPENLNLIPVINDYRGDSVCAVLGCKETGVEFHHMAPQALQEFFGQEWYAWPGINLCRTHHGIWHSIVTWYMPGPSPINEGILARYGNTK